MQEAHLAEAERLAAQGKDRGIIRALHRLRGAWRLTQGESPAVARAALDLGFHISFSGILTFRNATELRDVARFVPLERCLIETDSPYLAPVPHRGRTNSPAYVTRVAAQLAQIKEIDVEAVARATSANFERLFRRVVGTTTGTMNS